MVRPSGRSCRHYSGNVAVLIQLKICNPPPTALPVRTTPYHYRTPMPKVEALLTEVSGEGDYVERSVKLDPMNKRQRWLIYEFVGANNPAVKLSNLDGPHFARGIQVPKRLFRETRTLTTVPGKNHTNPHYLAESKRQ